jgi:selenocysteine-specific elongation factor
VRLWVDRAFTIRGAGLVVTGTLPAGTVRVGDTLELARTGGRLVVRELQTLNQHADEVSGVARVALNLRGPGRVEIARGDALLTPGSYRCTEVADIRTRHCTPSELPRELLVHVGTATVLARLRPIGPDTARALSGGGDCHCGSATGSCCDLGRGGRWRGAARRRPGVLNRRGATRRRASELDTYTAVPTVRPSSSGAASCGGHAAGHRRGAAPRPSVG